MALLAAPALSWAGTGEPDDQLWTELRVVAPLASTTTVTGISQLRLSETMDAQGEIILAGDVRYFANHLPRVLTDRERLAEEWVRFLKQHMAKTRGDDRMRERTLEMTR